MSRLRASDEALENNLSIRLRCSSGPSRRNPGERTHRRALSAACSLARSMKAYSLSESRAFWPLVPGIVTSLEGLPGV